MTTRRSRRSSKKEGPMGIMPEAQEQPPQPLLPEFADWRIDTAARLAQEYESRPIGTPIYLTSYTKHPAYNYLTFFTPSATALALKVATEGALEAENSKKTLALTNTLFGTVMGKAVQESDIRKLYDIFESCMIAVTFSFQALEVFCNGIIGRRVSKPLPIKRKNLYVALNPANLERQLSTDEKLAEVLPEVLSVKNPKGTKIWELFKELKDARDSSVHLKSVDAYSNANNLDHESLFFHFLNNSVTKYPKNAVAILEYYFPQNPPVWLQEASKRAKQLL